MNETVREISAMNITGNVMPLNWVKHITHDNGKPNLNACVLLADLVYWYREVEVRDEATGQVIGRKQRFKGHAFQRHYKNYADLFGMTKRQVQDAMSFLHNKGIIKRWVETIEMPDGRKLSNCPFFEPIPEAIMRITHGEVPVEQAAEEADMDLSDEGTKEVFNSYASNIQAVIPPIIGEKIGKWLDDPSFAEPSKLLIYAIEIAAENNVRKWTYIEAILIRWSDHHVKTLKQAQNFVAERTRSKGNSGKVPKDNDVEITEDDKFWT